MRWGSTIKFNPYWLNNLTSPSPLRSLLSLFFSFFTISLSHYWDKLPSHWSAQVFSIYSGQSLPIRVLSNIMPDPIERVCGKEWMLSSSPVSRLFQVLLWQTMHSATLIFFRCGLAWWLQHGTFNHHQKVCISWLFTFKTEKQNSRRLSSNMNETETLKLNNLNIWL